MKQLLALLNLMMKHIHYVVIVACITCGIGIYQIISSGNPFMMYVTGYIEAVVIIPCLLIPLLEATQRLYQRIRLNYNTYFVKQ